MISVKDECFMAVNAVKKTRHAHDVHAVLAAPAQFTSPASSRSEMDVSCAPASPIRSTYGPALWAHILRDQLDVDEAAFRAAVRDGVKPTRGALPAPAETLPADLASLLVNRVGLTREQIAVMSKAEAIERLNRYWTEDSWIISGRPFLAINRWIGAERGLQRIFGPGERTSRPVSRVLFRGNSRGSGHPSRPAVADRL
jgi:hypothetical protein